MLRNAAKDGRIDMLYELLGKDPYLLENLGELPVSDTPLHESARAGKAHFCMEILTLMPSLAWKLNQQGLSPMHLALINGHSETARGFANVDVNLIRVKGKGRVTPLHVLAEIGDVNLLEEFLFLCPTAIQDLTVCRETVVHVAVKNGEVQAFRFLFGWLHRQNLEDILDWKDEDGNTVLHLAVMKNQPEVLKLLINNVDFDAKNAKNNKATDLKEECIPEIKRILRRHSFLSSHLNSLIRKRDHELGLINNGNIQGLESFTIEIRGVVLVLAVLIATATYQAILSPPGGYWQDNADPQAVKTNGIDDERKWHKPGKVIMKPFESSFFTLMNTAAFSASICTIIVLVMGLPFAFLLEASTLFISCSYFFTILTIFPSLDATTECLLLLSWVILLCVHLVAFEARRRKRENCRVGKYQWRFRLSQDNSALSQGN
ncbi:Ankyrin repeat family protein [Euphorbia peplus]|nr:Ankyrin repeat family protein [Euphorbia peplus]